MRTWKKQSAIYSEYTTAINFISRKNTTAECNIDSRSDITYIDITRGEQVQPSATDLPYSARYTLRSSRIIHLRGTRERDYSRPTHYVSAAAAGYTSNRSIYIYTHITAYGRGDRNGAHTIWHMGCVGSEKKGNARDRLEKLARPDGLTWALLAANFPQADDRWHRRCSVYIILSSCLAVISLHRKANLLFI